MQIYWCDNCEVPILYGENRDDLRFESNSYIDLEDELLDWLIDNNGLIKHYNLFMSLKQKVRRAIEHGWVSKLKIELETKTEDDMINHLNQYALKYLNRKLENEKKVSKSFNGNKCPNCNNRLRYIGKDIRPVFIEERLMLSLFLGIDLVHKNVWNTISNRYIIDGKVSYIDYNKLYNVEDLEKKVDLLLSKIAENNQEVDFHKFIEVNRNHYQFIDNQAISFIQKASSFFHDRLQLVSFSGGKDSTVVSDLVTRALGKQDILHVFGDTTLELPFTYEYIERIKNRPVRPPFLPVDKSDKDFFELSKLIGPPSRVISWCCTIFKTGPIGNFFRQIAKEQNILTYYGVRRSESNSRSQYDKISKSPKISKQLVVSPIIDWYDADIWLYIITRGIDFNDAYRYGFTRVGCWCCPNNSKWSEFLAKIYLKEKAQKWRNFLIEFAKDIGKTKDPEVYVDEGYWKARQGGRGITNKEIAVTLESKPCALENRAKNYNLSRPISNELYELFKPFGEINFDFGNKILNEVYILDPINKQPKFILQGKEGSNQLKVIVVKEKNDFLLFQRIECQLRKYQSCIYCTACPNVCRMMQ